MIPRLAAVVALFASSVAAQDRARLLGSVASADGEAWVGAHVVLHSPADWIAADDGEPDTVRVVTDKRGRFRARVARGRTYAAWAWLPGAPKRVTAVRADLVAGRVTHLVEAKGASDRLQVEVSGFEPWKQHGTAALRAVDKLGVHHEVVLDAKGVASLDGVAESATIELVLDGALLHSAKVELGEKVELELPPPLRVPVRVVDAATKKPLANARVTYGRDGAVHPPAVNTDADGRCELHVPSPAKPTRSGYYHLAFVARRRGYALVRGGFRRNSWAGMRPLEDEELKTGVAKELVLGAKPGFTLAGVVRGTDKVSAAGLRLFCRLPGITELRKNSWSNFHTFEWTRASDDGSYAFHGLCKRSSNLQLGLSLPRARLVALLGDKATELPSSNLIWIPVAGIRRTVTKDLTATEIDLGGLRMLDLRLRLPDGRPAAFTKVWVLSSQTKQFHRLENASLRPVRADRRGRCRLLCHEAKPLLIASGADHYRVGLVDVQEVAEGPLEMLAYETVTGRVVDAEGKPLAGAKVAIRSQTWSSVGGSFQGIIGSLNRALLATTSDANGHFKARFIPEKGLSYGINASAKIDDKWIRTEDEVKVGQESVKDAELTVPASAGR